jgi:hypothetical protein
MKENNPKRVGFIGANGAWPLLSIEQDLIGKEIIEVVNLQKEEVKPDPFAPEPLLITRLKAPEITPIFIEKPRKKRRQDLFKR